MSWQHWLQGTDGSTEHQSCEDPDEQAHATSLHALQAVYEVRQVTRTDSVSLALRVLAGAETTAVSVHC